MEKIVFKIGLNTIRVSKKEEYTKSSDIKQALIDLRDKWANYTHDDSWDISATIGDICVEVNDIINKLEG